MDKQIQLLMLVCAASFIAGCRQEQVRVYEVPREQIASAGSATAVQVPAGWEEMPPGDMRLASYAVKGTNGAKADVGVIRLANTSGSNLEPVNRWRSSVGQKPFTETDLAKAAQPVTIGGTPGKLYEVNGASAETDDPTRLLGAIVVTEDSSWYFKMTGDDKLVAAQKPVFLKFIESYPLAVPHQHQHGPGDGHNHGDETAAADPHAGLNVPAAAASADASSSEQSWPAPPSWQQQTPGIMQQAKFSVGGGKAVVTVSEAGGSLAANVLRWRGQLGMPGVSEADAEKSAQPLDLGGAQARIVDLPGAQQSMVAIILPKGQSSVFYKLMGDPAAVAAEKNALIEFAKKVK